MSPSQLRELFERLRTDASRLEQEAIRIRRECDRAEPHLERWLDRGFARDEDSEAEVL